MEEVDTTLFNILDTIGCNLSSLGSIASFKDEHIYQASAACVRRINPDSSLPEKLPGGKAGRFRLATDLSNTIKNDLGYASELGYQAFLYPNEKDMRKLLMWLVDKLPKDEDEGTGSSKEASAQVTRGAGASLERSIIKALQEWSSELWSPLTRGSVKRAVTTCPLGVPAKGTTAETRYFKLYQPTVVSQPTQQHRLAPSLFELNTGEIALVEEQEKLWASQAGDAAQRRAGLAELLGDSFRGALLAGQDGLKSANLMDTVGGAYVGSAFTRRADFSQEKQEVVRVGASGEAAAAAIGAEAIEEAEKLKAEQERKERESEIAALQEQLDKLQALLKKMNDATTENLESFRQLEAELNKANAATKGLEDTYKVKKRTLDLLPNADKNLAELKRISEASAKRLMELAKEWEKHRIPLVNKLRSKKAELALRKENIGLKVDQIKRMRQDMKDKARDLRDKADLHQQVLDELNRMPKSINRQVYIGRIMDIVKNLDKQKGDIRKILVDVRKVKKDINSIAETSQRSFAVADEVVFQAAKGKTDNTATQAYKYVVKLRQGFVKLVDSVEETGKVNNEVRDIAARIESIESRNNNLNMKRVLTDLEQVKKENKGITREIKALKNA